MIHLEKTHQVMEMDEDIVDIEEEENHEVVVVDVVEVHDGTKEIQE